MPDELTALANRYGSDKGDLHFSRHQYARLYSRFFEPLRDKAIRLLELGLQHPRDTRRGACAPSLSMWSDYFPRAMIVGFDIEDFSAIRIDRCTIVQGDMASRESLSRLCDLGPFDIIVDDASHASEHQQIALGFLFPIVAGGGFYIIEDLHWQPPEMERDAVPKTRDLLRLFRDTRALRSPAITEWEAAYLSRNISDVEMFDSRDIFKTDARDGLAVIRKR